MGAARPRWDRAWNRVQARFPGKGEGMDPVVFTPADRLVLQSYAAMLDGLAEYLGDGYEFVLYSLEDVQRSVVKIVNGHYTGRTTSAPLSGIARSILDHFQEDGGQEYVSYTTHNKDGEKLKFTAIALRGENNRIIGLLCINSYLHTSQKDVLTNFFENPAVLEQLSDAKGTSDPLRDAVMKARQAVEADASVLPSLKNKEIVSRLDAQGVFRLKNAVVRVAEILGISKNTVYMHLRSAGGK